MSSDLKEPEGTTELMSVMKCAVCGDEHPRLLAEKVDVKLIHDGDVVTHVAVCPTFLHVLYFVDKDGVSCKPSS